MAFLVFVEWGCTKQKCFVVNIYAPCNIAGKRKLWEDLRMTKTGFGKGKWCLVGDFNAVSRSCERKGVGGQISNKEMVEFTSFAADMELLDLPLLGRKFTWYRSDGTAMSRVDRFLLLEDWISNWGVVAQWALRRDVSDHCPITLKMGCQDWVPKPFRFNNCWMNHLGFKKVVLEGWSNGVFRGWKAYVLSEKLKNIRGIIRNWNVQIYESIEGKIKLLEGKICELDLKADDVGLSEGEVESRSGLFTKL